MACVVEGSLIFSSHAGAEWEWQGLTAVSGPFRFPEGLDEGIAHQGGKAVDLGMPGQPAYGANH